MPMLLAKCLEAVYDVTQGDLVLKVFVEELKSIRVIVINKRDFFNSNTNSSIDEEMEKTGKLWVGKTFNWKFEDDPNTKTLNEIEEAEFAEKFKENIANTLQNTAAGMADDDAQMKRFTSKQVNKPDNHLDALIAEQLELARKRNEDSA